MTSKEQAFPDKKGFSFSCICPEEQVSCNKVDSKSYTETICTEVSGTITNKWQGLKCWLKWNKNKPHLSLKKAVSVVKVISFWIEVNQSLYNSSQ